MTRIEQEKKTVSQMVEIYCHGKKHTKEGLCEECSALLDYAYTRLEHCKFGEKKPTCKNVLFTAISLTEKYKCRLLCAMQAPVCCGTTPLLQ